MCQKYRTQRYRHPLILKAMLSLKPCCFFISSEVISLLHPIKFYYFSIVLFSFALLLLFEDIKRCGIFYYSLLLF